MPCPTLQLSSDLLRLRTACALRPHLRAGAPHPSSLTPSASACGSEPDCLIVVSGGSPDSNTSWECQSSWARASASGGASAGMASDSDMGGSPRAAASARSSLDDSGSADVAAVARALLAAGYLVQLRDEAQTERPRDVRRCLQQLRHRFIVCIGARGAAPARSAAPLPAAVGASAGDVAAAAAAAAISEALGGEDEYLADLLVVEPRFREQFVIAHSTPAYDALLEVRGFDTEGLEAGLVGWRFFLVECLTNQSYWTG